MTSWQSLHKDNQEMVDKFIRLTIIQSKEVENAFRCVSRAAFVSNDRLDEAFLDAPFRGSPHIHMSAPHMYAAILEDLELEPGMSFLNIGSGTGYFSCLAGYLIKQHGINHGVELHKDLLEFSHERVKDFLQNGPAGASEITPPLLISGNAFQLDPSQMKYDRLYCGGACLNTTVTFFLEFLKVGGFLIAPVGSKLIKLERVSPQEGVRTVISDVCFAPLTRLSSDEVSKLRSGLLSHTRFPIKTKKKKPKKTIFGNVNFPVSTSSARKKISRLRAMQHVLDSLDENQCIPQPFCYVPNIEQINTYKQYKKVIECKGSAPLDKNSYIDNNNTTNSSTLSPPPSSAEDRHSLLNALRQSGSTTTASSSNAHGHLMTIQEFLMAASPETIFQEFLNGSRNDSNLEQGVVSPTTGSSVPNNNRQLAAAAGDSHDNISARRRQRDATTTAQTTSPTRNIKPKAVVEYTDCDSELHGKVSKDIYEHLSSDRLWETVVDYYYSVCATTKNRQDECFDLKGVEIVHPAVARLADVLLFKMSKNKPKRQKSTEAKRNSNDTGHCHTTDSSLNVSANSITDNDNDDENYCEVKEVLGSVLDKVCLGTEDDRQVANTSSDSLDSVVILPSFDGDAVDESLSDSFDKKNKNPTSKNATGSRIKRRTSPRYVKIMTDNKTSECISKVENVRWSHEHDIGLISFLATFGKDTDPNTLRDALPKDLTVEIFDQSKLIKFPLLSSVDPSMLCYRAVGLLRVAKVLDSVLDILIGPSLPRNQFANPFKEEFSLPSFLERSFEASDSQVNVFEAKSNTSNDNNNGDESILDDDEKKNYRHPTSVEDKELMQKVQSMLEYELSNVDQQQMILMKKLNLIKSIDEQYKEQVKLLNQQLMLIDEQQRLLVDVHMEAGNSEEVALQMATSQLLVTERKQQRQRLLGKRDKINEDRAKQLIEKKEVLTMLERLLTLHVGLNTELDIINQKGMTYLKSAGDDLSSFSRFIRKADGILQKLKAASRSQGKEEEEEDDDEEKSISNAKEKSQIKKKQINDSRRILRYQPDTILSRCRFLLPLSKKRYNYLKEMLRTTERPAPKHVMTVINVDRRVPVVERHLHGESCTVFMQIYGALKKSELNYRWNRKSYEQWWEVKFSGEGIIDQGGGFRDSLTEVSEELCPSLSTTQPCLPLFIKTPNQVSGIGDNLDSYTLNPNCKQLRLYRWLGQLFGACFRTDETIPLALTPLLWKQLIGEFVSWKTDFVYVDEATVRQLDGLENLEEQAYRALNIDQTYSTILSDQTVVDLLPGGSEIVVKCSDRAKYSKMVRKARMMENIEQVKALREGLLAVIPEAVLSCLTWKNLERGVCGSPSISVTDLKANCRYGDKLSPTSSCVLHMWSAISTFTDEERSRFLRFITGRKRLPSPFIVFRASSELSPSKSLPAKALPSASTCGSNFFLPDYSSPEIAREKIRYAIYNCVAIDTDTSPW